MPNNDKISTLIDPNEGRKTIQWTEYDFLRNRFNNFLGSDMPQTIAAKELIDNATDQISDMRTSKAYVEIGADLRSITVVDGGSGISTKRTIRDDTGNESTYLYLALAKLYNSTNYDENMDDSKTVGFNGVGTKCNNFLSSIFTAGKIGNAKKFKGLDVVPKDKDISGEDFNSGKFYNIDIFNKNYRGDNLGVVYGYNFMQGSATIDGENPQDENNPQWINIRTPLLEGEKEPYGYLVHAQYDNSIVGFQDEIDPIWIRDYLKSRLESIEPKEDIFFTYRYPIENEDGTFEMKHTVYVRPVDRDSFLKKYEEEINNGIYEILDSWEDQVKRIAEDPKNQDRVFGPYKVGYFDMLFAKDPEIFKDVQNICQGSVVNNPKSINVTFDVAGQNVRMRCPVVWKLSAKRSRGLLYTDQTKRRIQSNRSTPKMLHLNNLEKQMRRIPELMAYWESEANSKFLKKQGKTIQSDFFFPASGGTTAREYFGAPLVKNKEYLRDTFNRIRDSEEVLNYLKDKKYDLEYIDNILNSNSKISKSKHKRIVKEVTEMQMVYHNLKEDDFDKEYKILLIVEGFSAASGIRTARDSSVVGVLALRGKILNVWNKSLANAMKSAIIKELLKVLQDDSYNLIISCTDADADGSSITTLLLGCLARYRKDILRDGKFCNNISPLYTFKDRKTKELVHWGNDKNDCPKGCKIVVNKGLGSYGPSEIKRLILNPSSGAIWEQLIYDKKAVKSLTMALESGGKELVYMDDANNNPVPFA